ncbi:DUF6759 domain-containing protein [Chryseobacterium koreense]|uniref:DUF6759 domain-containing protein n=1 Tax=Chryseobacterium koreense TaxID=232216 RepID=UPI00065ABDA6|nr:DUF6759 domain-containing protein [Chryseobacterium koreense]MBB5333227.1 hypothetical protein [Chryseobacterium koreense]
MKSISALLIFLIVTSCEVLPLNSPASGNYPKQSTNNTSNESKEFADLMASDKIDKKKVTAQVLTYLLNDTDPKDTKTAAVITNESNCDIIVRLVGTQNNKFYNLPVSKNSKNQFVIEKGGYTLNSNVCGAKYYSQKIIVEPLIITLSN